VAGPGDGWIRVASADLAPGAVVEADQDPSIGEDLVVWRTADGTPCVMEARCPHQWSHLAGEGVVDGEELVCLTHLWRFAVDGAGWKANMAGRRDRKGDIVVYPCREDGGAIWIRSDDDN